MSNVIHTTPTKLRDALNYLDQLDLLPDFEGIYRGLLYRELHRVERIQARALAKAAAEEEAASGHAEVGLDASKEDNAQPEASQEGMFTADPESCTGVPECPTSTELEPKVRGHGRNGAGAYVDGEHIHHQLRADIIGALCDACGLGHMGRYRPKLIVAIKGQPLFDATTHHFEQARCKLCGAIIRAEGPAVVEKGLGSSYITYEWSACAMLVVMHYFAGLPFKRIESLQAGWGIPVPDANLWTLADKGAELLLPLYNALEKFGIRKATALRIDDTGSMITSLRREIRTEIAALEARGESSTHVRTGINATGVYLETEQGKVLLFYTGRHHAGEIIDRIMKHRTPTEPGTGPKLVKVSDAASKNFSHAHPDELEEAVCNAHAYLKFRAIKDQYPEEHRVAGEVYKDVFDNDDRAKAQGLSPIERTLFHRDRSLPEMKRLRKMCLDKLESKLVEPKSPLWEPLTFIINQWERLTKFCTAPGIPLDTNIVEQMLIIPVRYLAASFNYRSQDGADVGDMHMSLISSANANGVEPVAYLTECLANHKDLAKRPEYYFPWAYRARIEACEQNGQTGPPSAPSTKGRDVVHALRPGVARMPNGAMASSSHSAASS